MKDLSSTRLHLVSKFFIDDRGLTIFLGLLSLLFFLGPIFKSTMISLFTNIFLSLFMILSVFSMSDRAETRYLVSFVVFTSIVLRWLTYADPSFMLHCWSSFASFLFMFFLTLVVLFKVFQKGKAVNAHLVRGAIAAYLLFGITWYFLYLFLDLTLPHAFSISGPDSLDTITGRDRLVYFSFVTLTTLGYGDITTTHPVSQMFAVVEALTGQLYPATLLARLISLEVSNRIDSNGDA